MTDTPRFHRRSIRLRDYDYRAAGAYFVTVCAHQRAQVFGQIRDGMMHVNAWGAIVAAEWERTAALRPYVELDAFVVMPNHFHGILLITDDATGRGMDSAAKDDVIRRGMARHAPTTNNARKFGKPIARSLPTIVGAFKSAATNAIHRLPDATDDPVWQRNYHEHVIRHAREYHQIRAYTLTNPARWLRDTFYEE